MPQSKRKLHLQAISTKRRKEDREQVRCDAFQNNGPLPGMESDPDSSLESDSSDDTESDGSESEYDFVESEHQLNASTGFYEWR